MERIAPEPSQIAAFTQPYSFLFKDKRLYDTFSGTLCGILNSGSLCINRIASRSPLGCHTRHAERRIRRLVHGENQRAPLPYDALKHRFSQQGAQQARGEHELLLILYVCYLRKPFATHIEHLDTVRDLEGNAVAGFYTLNVLAIAASGKRALIYHKTLSTREPGFKSLTDEYLKAIDQSTDVLRQQGVGRIICLLDRGFDDLKLMRHIHQQNNLFVLRAQHHTRQALTRVDGRPQGIRTVIQKTPVLTQLTLERLLFDPQAGRRRSVEVTVQAVSFELVEARGLLLTGVMVGSAALAEGWLLLSKLPLTKEAEQDVMLATRLLLRYRQRWAVEMNQAQCTHTSIALYPLAA